MTLCTVPPLLCKADYNTKWALNPNRMKTTYCERATRSYLTLQMAEPFKKHWSQQLYPLIIFLKESWSWKRRVTMNTRSSGKPTMDTRAWNVERWALEYLTLWLVFSVSWGLLYITLELLLNATHYSKFCITITHFRERKSDGRTWSSGPISFFQPCIIPLRAYS